MTHKEDAIREIVAIVKNHGITIDDIANALVNSQTEAAKTSTSVLSKLFGYLGGILVFAGICVFISMYWNDFGPAARVIVTLGSGFAAFVMALVCLGDPRYERAATPLFLISAILQPTGIVVMLKEYSSGGDERHGVLFMATYMIIQQGAVFWAKQRTALAFSTILFGSIFFATACDLLDINHKLSGVIYGVAMLCISYDLNRSRHQAIAPFWFFTGAVVLLASAFNAVNDTPFELSYLGLSAFIIFLSTTIRSRTLLLVGTVSMLLYIGYFSAEHFADTVGWPITLVIIGMALIGLSSFAVKLNAKYIKN